MTPKHYNRHAKHWQALLETNRDIENDVPRPAEQGNSDQATPCKTTEPIEIVNRMDTESTANSAKKLILWIVALYAVPTYILLIAIDASRQIHDLNSFMLHMPVILVGGGLLGSIHTAARRNNWPLLIWFSAVLWMLGLWT